MNYTFPLVSVIIPGYNYGKYLRQRIDSVLQQDYPNIEVILLDDCSTDDSQEIMLSYKDNPKISHIAFNEINSGNPFVQWDKGIALAKGDYIWIAEADDYADKDFVSSLMQELLKDKEAVIAFSHSIMVNAQGCPMNYSWDTLYRNKKPILYNGHDFCLHRMVCTNKLYNASMIIFRRESYNKITGEQYKKFNHSGDWLFWFLLTIQGKICEIPKTLNYFRQHSQKVTVEAQRTGYNFDEDAAIQTIITERLAFTNYQSCCLRGRQTKHLKKSNLERNMINQLVEKHPKIYGGTFLDIITYTIDKISHRSGMYYK